MPVAVGLLALGAAHAFDFVSFLAMVGRHGLAAEVNPLVVALAQNVGLAGLTIAKVGSVAIVAFTTLVLSPSRRRLATGVLMFGIGVGLLGGLSNVATT